ncbi:monovalent cation/H+ antiporter subunit A [Rhodococcus ruber BKS 20-38]|uniref:Monovalent cation/H+ antiporter subunit A n=1 Tax=Rhodococcus ruber BKS 20-38 TaxID=1278076 RepID=M2ZMY1_9NOCA|nr:monovalent cation/H+ antiporter subunit A [Rhodococcus ruber BKS 20-38]
MVLVAVLGLLVLTAAVAPVLDRYIGRSTGWVVAAVFLALGAVVARAASTGLSGGGVIEYSVPWIPAVHVNFALRLDGTGLLFVALVLGVGALVMAYSARYFSYGRHTGFFLLMSLFAAAMFGLVVADDVVLLFVFWEFTTICSFFLIGRSGYHANKPALRTFLLTAAGGLCLLAAVVAIRVYTGTSQLSVVLTHPVWAENPVFTRTVGVLIMVAAFTKSAQFPFHYWLPDAMAAATPVSAYLHAAAMVKAGIYLLMRFSPALRDSYVWEFTLVTVGLFTALLGAVFALQRQDLKELLAYSTVSQLGFLVAVVGVGTPGALGAAGLHTLAHALFKATLFMLVGVIDREVGNRDIRELTGLWRVMPLTAALTALSALSMAGVPPLLGFISKENLFAAFLETPGPGWLGTLVGAVAVGAAVLTFAYSFRIVYGAFGGPTTQRKLREPSLVFLLPAAVSSFAGLVFGLHAEWLSPLIDRIVLDLRGEPADVTFTLWHGITAPVVMSLVAIVVGTGLFVRRAAVDRMLDRRLFPVTGVGVFESLFDGTIAFGRRVGDLTRTMSPARHLALPFALLAALAAALVLAAPAGPDLPAPPAQPLDWLLLVLVAVAVAGLVSTGSRLAALVLLGVAGFVVALLFFTLGAPDVGLTQLLVEVLTVVLAVLILRRLPRDFHRVGRRRKAVAAAVAALAGSIATLAVYLLTGRREISSAGRYYLDEAYAQTGGTNVVNTILVDFRALDTLGELTVLGVAGLVVVSVLDSTGLLRTVPDREGARYDGTPIGSAVDNTLLARTVGRWLAPVLVILSLYLLFRGHYEPGGGFISALVGGAGFALAYLSAPNARAAQIHLPYIAMIAWGIGLATSVGLLGFVDGSFLRPLHVDIPLPGGATYGFTTALLFDIGVYLVVVGVILAALDRLGAEETPDDAPPSEPGPHAAVGGQTERSPE